VDADDAGGFADNCGCGRKLFWLAVLIDPEEEFRRQT
jgi:hypothetical protein